MGNFKLKINKPNKEKTEQEELLKKAQELIEDDSKEVELLKKDQEHIKDDSKEVRDLQKENPIIEQEKIEEPPKGSKKKQKGPQKRKKREKAPKSKPTDGMNELELRVFEKERKFKRRKILLSTALFGTIVILLVTGIYTTFFKKEQTIQETAVEVNRLNNYVPFHTDTLQAFVRMNLETQIKEGGKISLDEGSKNLKIDYSTIEVYRIDKITPNISNVWVLSEVQTDKNKAVHNFIWPIYYDHKENIYYSAGEISMTPQILREKLEVKENKTLSFEDVEKVKNEDLINSVRSKINNFLLALYNDKGQDISTMYQPDKNKGDISGLTLFADPTLKMDKITDIEVYNGTNALGYNVLVRYNVITDSGIKYNNHSYIFIEINEGGTGMIKKIL